MNTIHNTNVKPMFFKFFMFFMLFVIKGLIIKIFFHSPLDVLVGMFHTMREYLVKPKES